MIKDDFPSLDILENGKKIAYLDSAATSFKPNSVINAVNDFYKYSNANPHRGVYELSYKATLLHEKAREDVASFINARSEREIIFTKGASEALNLIAYSYGLNFINQDDEIIIYVAEHHSNFVPWQFIRDTKGAKLVFVHPDENGHFDLSEYKSKISDKTRLVVVAEVSNVLGVRVPVEEIVELAHKNNALVCLDAAQSISHIKADVQKMDVDFLAFSAHKMYAPMGLGILYGKEEILEKMPPFLFGGDMIKTVKKERTTYAPLPLKFEAGTQNVAAEVGLSEAINYINNISYEKIIEHEKVLWKKLMKGMLALDNIIIYGDKKWENKTGVVAFNVKDVHPHDTSSILSSDGIAIRAGHHCANPLMEHLKIGSCCRVSLAIYNTEEDIDKFLTSLATVRGVMGYES